MNSSRPLLASILIATSAIAAPAIQDTPPIDPNQLLQALKMLKEQQAQQSRTARQGILKSAQSAAASPAAAAAAWIESVKQTQFVGVDKESAQFREWKDRDGALFSEKEVQSAAHLYFRWLAITAQHSGGTPVRELLPSIIQYTRDVIADALAMDALMEQAQKERDRAQGRAGNVRPGRTLSDQDRIKREHDQILSRPLPTSPPVRALRAEELIKGEGGKWEMRPGNVDGIFQNVILPEFRAARDMRALEYWDMKIKLEGDAVKNKPTFDQEKFNQERRPELLWNRAKELIELGMRNRGLGELFQVVRANPQHPLFNTWVEELEKIVSGSTAAPAPGGAPPAGFAPGAASPAGTPPATR